MEKLLKFTYPALFIFSALIFLGHYIVSGQAVYGDGIGYYAHLHSWVFDGDWDNTNEYKHVYSPENNNVDNPKVAKIPYGQTNESGKVMNHFGPGMAFLLLPFYVLAHFLANLGDIIGSTFHPNGYSDIYQIFVGMGGIFYTLIGLYLLERLINGFIKDKKLSRLSAIVLFLATNLIYYGAYNVLTSHFSSLFFSVLFFYILIFLKENYQKLFYLGIVAGLATTNRPQDGFLAAVLIIYFVNSHRASNLDLRKGLKEVVKKIAIFTLGFFITFSLLLVHLHSNYNSLKEHTYIQEFILTFTGERKVKILGSLFDPMNGLFTKTPILLPVVIYFLYLLYKKRSNIYYDLAFIFFAGQLVIIELQRGWQAAAYGGRMYVSSLVFFGLILGELSKEIKSRFGEKVLVIIIIIFTVFNFYNIINFTLYEKQATLGRKGVEDYTLKRIERIYKNIGIITLLE